MRLISAQMSNFGSYKKVDLDYTDAGLTLVNGETGAGKSTLCDIAPWILFGVTAKNGTVDEVRSWNTPEPTKGELKIYIGEKVHTITRIRGDKVNDLYFEVEEILFRGSIMSDTQKLLNSILGTTADIFLAGSYFHEFSQTAQFFTTSAKNRRGMCEQIADLGMAKRLQIALTSELKIAKTGKAVLDGKLSNIKTLQNYIATTIIDRTRKANMWRLPSLTDAEAALVASKATLINQRQANATEIEKEETFLRNLKTDPCSECGGPKKHEAIDNTKEIIKLHQTKLNAIMVDLYAISNIENKLQQVKNPHWEIVDDLTKQISKANEDFADVVYKVDELSYKISDLELLSEVLNSFRARVIQDSVEGLETMTNKLLDEHYDGEIRVEFSVKEADKLDVTLAKDGNACSYTQLSKGQRCLLKLCFGIAMMKQIANQQGVSFNSIFFDEALDGMSEHLKQKTYGLLKHFVVDYESVFVVEHSSALKECFENKIEVTITKEGSILG